MANLLCGKLEGYPLLYDKKMKGYKEINVVSNAWKAGRNDLNFIENGKINLIFFFLRFKHENIAFTNANHATKSPSIAL